jgi:hypothetical protein
VLSAGKCSALCLSTIGVLSSKGKKQAEEAPQGDSGRTAKIALKPPIAPIFQSSRADLRLKRASGSDNK